MSTLDLNGGDRRVVSIRQVLGWSLAIVASLGAYLLSDIREIPVLKERIETQRAATIRLEAKLDALSDAVDQLPDRMRDELRRELSERDARRAR